MLARPCVLALAAVASACADGFTTPSAYDAEPDVCGDAAARANALAECAAAAACGGIVGYAGILEAREVRVGGPIDSTRATDVSTASGTFWNVVEAVGASPYFNFVLKVESLGGEVAGELTDRSLVTSRAAAGAADALADALVGFELRLATSAESQAFAAVNGGALAIEEQTEGSLTGTFDVLFGADDTLSGCFSLTPTSRRVTTE